MQDARALIRFVVGGSSSRRRSADPVGIPGSKLSGDEFSRLVHALSFALQSRGAGLQLTQVCSIFFDQRTVTHLAVAGNDVAGVKRIQFVVTVEPGANAGGRAGEI